MSDVVLIALFAIIGSAASGLLASWLTGKSLRKNTQIQIDARFKELSQQIKHQEIQQQKVWQIEARKGYLIPLREELSQWKDNLFQSTVAAAEFIIVKRKKGDIKSAVDNLNSSVEKTFLSDIHLYMGQTSDTILFSLVTEFIQAAIKYQEVIAPLLYDINNPQNLNDDALQLQVNEIEEHKNKILKLLIPINKQIEDLLSGQEAK